MSRWHELEGGGYLHIDRVVVPVAVPKCACGNDSCAIDEDDTWWCKECMDKWETETGRRWGDGAPLK